MSRTLAFFTSVVGLLVGAMPVCGQSLRGSGQPAGSLEPVPGVTRLLDGPAPQAAQVAPGEPPPETGPVIELSVDEAVALALEQNLTIQVQRIQPQIQDLRVLEARTAWTPQISTSVRRDSQDSPSNSFLSGGQERVSDDQISSNVGVSQQLPWGGTYSASWDSPRTTTSNIFSNFDPVLRSNLNLAYEQPLLRNFSIDPARQQLLVTTKNRETSEIELRATVLQTVRNVKNAYWNLVYARSLLQVQQQSLELARESLRGNRTRVQIGTMAPIDIVEAEAEVARNEESVILAEASIEDAEDRLRALILDPERPDFWTARLVTTDAPLIDVRPIDVDGAVQRALTERTDLRQARTGLETTDINIRYYRNQTLPFVNVRADYGLSGLGGTQLIRGEGFPGPIVGEDQRSFGSVLGDIFSNDFPAWTLQFTVGYPIGTSQAEANLERARLERTQGVTQIRNLELQVATQIRELGRRVNTNLKRVDATRVARELAERRLEAEQKKFEVGMSTSFLVFQAQRDLSVARDAELRAVLDYNQALVDFEAAQETALSSGSGIVVGSGTGSQFVQTPTQTLGGTSAVAGQR